MAGYGTYYETTDQLGFTELHVAGYDSTEPYDGRVCFFTEPIMAGYDMMMMMPIEANVLRVYVFIHMYHAFHVSSPQRY